MDSRRSATARTFASLCPDLLARKGGARPAMRSHPQGDRFGNQTCSDPDSDLGWNDFGDDETSSPVASADPSTLCGDTATADIVPIGRDGVELAEWGVPTVNRGRRTARTDPRSEGATPRRSALAAGRRAAFTLRLDAERHLRLRLACAIDARSAQHLVTEALDRLLADMPDIAALATHVSGPAKS
ncbi:MAG: hypothetical protein V4579_09110 [Pseudomonadota bacterium]